MSAFFVTATGTDIGKTFVTAGLVRTLRAQGEDVNAIKPLASGFAMEAAAASDAGVLLEALGRPLDAARLDAICPWRFAAPLSPDMAAAREGRSVDYDALVAFCRARIADARGPLFVEGVGGVMVPLDASRTVLDWMVALRLPLILVAGSYLGTISHTLTALAAVRRAGLRVAALVVNETGDGAVPLDETLGALARFADGVPVVAVRRGGPASDFALLARRLCFPDR